MRRSFDIPFTSDNQQVIWVSKEVSFTAPGNPPAAKAKFRFAPLQPLRNWIDQLSVEELETAHLICRMIPAQCPFERRFTLLGRTVLYVPPLCKLNPLYDQFVGLRFRALCYLADTCGEDVSQYC